jgi:multicomponent Na+:H+ antiporter subunit E
LLRRDRKLHARRPGALGQASTMALVSMTIVLAIAWLLWSGLYKPMLLGLGALSVGLTLILAVRMNFFRHTEGLPAMLIRLPGYWWWLLKEIVISSIDVTRIVLSPSLPISPSVIKIRSERLQELPQVILGNSVTLSPGTITIDIDEHELIVHCLSDAGAQDLREGELMRRVQKLERG